MSDTQTTAQVCLCGQPARENAYGHSCDQWPHCSTSVATLSAGQQFTALTTGTLRGKRFTRLRHFVASRDQDIEHGFISGDGRCTPQDRVFVEYPVRNGSPISAPARVVAGSIKVVPA